ncbi:hypothetical protein P9250_19690 [Caballeronia sp. LP006]|uniref:hypothetical protein n=1 Tax=Caballeronia sp. LP006 TaxID=3038552 RepID=UPI002857B3B0|nr:hypothetical protein [Caballeronia sp. LP006]MDR5830099.1 hypothetical protein [Caballeronia sp. LP006]
MNVNTIRANYNQDRRKRSMRHPLAFASLALAAYCVVAPAIAAGTGTLPTESVFNLVADTASKICGDVPDSGWNVDASANAGVDAPLGEFFKKLFDARVTGKVGVDGGKYAGPLRDQLKEVRRDTQDCKKVVADELLQYVRQTQKTENVPESKRVQIGSMRLVPNVVRYPKESAEEFANRFIKLVDAGNYSEAYQNLDPSVRAMQSRETFIGSLQARGSRCYPAQFRRELVSQVRMIPANQSLFRRDEYGYSFRTRFKDSGQSGGRDPDELVGVVLSDSGLWQVLEFTSTCLAEGGADQ